MRHAPSPAGYARLLGWLGGFGTACLAGIEGTGSYGAGLAWHIAAAGVRVVEVDRSDRQDRRRQGKSDPLDAVSAARAAQSGRSGQARWHQRPADRSRSRPCPARPRPADARSQSRRLSLPVGLTLKTALTCAPCPVTTA